MVSARMCSSRSRITLGRSCRAPARCDLAKRPARPGRGGAALAFDGVGVDVGAGEAVQRGDQVGADALRHEVGVAGDARDRRPRRRRRRPSARATSTRRRRRPPRSAWPDHDLRRRDVHGLERPRRRSGSAARRRRLVPARGQRRDAARCRRPARPPARRSRARRRRPARCRACCASRSASQHLRRELHRRDLVQRAVGLPRPRGVRTSS